jgi:hypothetical protein
VEQYFNLHYEVGKLQASQHGMKDLFISKALLDTSGQHLVIQQAKYLLRASAQMWNKKGKEPISP